MFICVFLFHSNIIWCIQLYIFDDAFISIKTVFIFIHDVKNDFFNLQSF